MSTVDLRGFVYGLEPVQQKQQWRLDALQVQLSKTHKQLQQHQAALDALQLTHREQSLHATQALQRQFNPAAHSLTLAYLAQLQEQIDVSQARLVQTQNEQKALQQACIAQQNRLVLLTRHREQATQAYMKEEANRLASEADRDWMARRQWRHQEERGDL